MPYDYKIRARLKRQSQTISSWPDIFDGRPVNPILECPGGDRSTSAHVRTFEQATQKVIQNVWEGRTSTTEIVRHWEHFILGQLLRLMQSMRRELGDLTQTTDLDEPCEYCLRRIASNFTQRMRVSPYATRYPYDVTSSPALAMDQVRRDARTTLPAEGYLEMPFRVFTLDMMDLYVLQRLSESLLINQAHICQFFLRCTTADISWIHL